MAVYKDHEKHGRCKYCKHFHIIEPQENIAACNNCKWLSFGNEDKWLPKVRRPLKTAESRKPIVNTGFTAAALWSELKRRQGGPYPCKKEFLIVTEGRFNAAVAAALRKA